ncbi:MAG: cytochrome c-type biogenesis protein CcmH [Chloroflexota bacterium]|nr:cytochrome c-type biogenesis protein CcmH [Chloroflexota bacterium]
MRSVRKRLPIILLGIILLSLAFPRIVTAQGPTPSDDEVNAVAKQLYCPVCENIPLDACGTQACVQWRGIIRDKLAEGWTEDEIKQYFVDQYGDRVLAEPPRRGLNWLVYIMPPAAFLVGAYFLYKGFRTWKTPSADHASPQESVSKVTIQEDKYIARLEEELRNR